MFMKKFTVFRNWDLPDGWYCFTDNHCKKDYISDPTPHFENGGTQAQDVHLEKKTWYRYYFINKYGIDNWEVISQLLS